MKKLYLIALALIGLSAKAQYFQHVYGTGNNDELSSGINTAAPMGHLMAGTTISCFPGITTIPVAHSDIAGNVFGAPFYENNYMLIRPTGVALTANDPKVVEFNTCPGHGVIGRYTDPTMPAPGNTGVFFLQLGAGGMPPGFVTATFDYFPVAGSGFDIVEIGGVAKSLFFPGDIYVTGTAVDPGGVNRVFALRINECTGALVWSQIYNILPPAMSERGMDIEEGPIMGLPFGMPDAVIVGEVVVNYPPVSNDGFLMHIDANTGIPAPHPVILYGFPNTNDHIHSVNQAIIPPFPPGFVLGGGTDINGSMDFFVLRMDFLIAPMWFNTYDYSMVPFSFNDCYDVVERMNTLGQPEYYATGHTQNGFFGGDDVMVVKIDQNGVGVAGGEFIYGSPGNDNSRSVAQLNIGAPGPPAGLSVFGTWAGPPSLGGDDMYHIKAYFNGPSGCNEIFNNPIQGPGLPPMPMMPFIQVNNFNQANLNAVFTPIFDFTLCFAPFIAGGNNARVAPAGEDNTNDNVLVMPNPAETGIRAVTVELESDAETDAVIAIYDMMGKELYNAKVQLVKGKNSIPVDISKANMAAGMYNVTIMNGENSQNKLLLVK